MKMKHKKANIPITILVIGIFVVCTLALLSFVLFKISVRESFVGVGLMEKINLQIEDYLVHKDFNRVDIKINDKGERVFYQEEKKKFGFLWWGEERVVFSVEAKVPS
jgi:hypothetical protein